MSDRVFDLQIGRRWVAWWGSGLTLIVLVVVFGHSVFLRGIARVLVTEDRLEPAAAIVILAGHLPFREMEAARLYHDGWAPWLVFVRLAESDEERVLRSLGLSLPQGWDLSRQLLTRLGVPPSAILIPDEKVRGGTLEEMGVVVRALKPGRASVILVTSKLHTRRVRLTWHYLTGGQSRGIVRAAALDPFDPNHWWQQRGFAFGVVREYLGLFNYWLGFPVPVRAGAGAE